MNKVEGKVADFCPKCKNGSVIVWKGVSNIVCEDPYDGMTKTLDADSSVCCSMFELKKEKEPCTKISLLQHELEMERLRKTIHQLEKEKSDHLKGIERLKKSQEKLQNQVKNLKVEAEENETMYNDLKKRAADSDYYKEKSELLEEGLNAAKRTSDLWKERCYKREEELKKANELADSWKRDYERIRDQFIYPIYDILYPDKIDLDINVTDFLNDIKTLKVYSDENGQMYKELQEWREKCIARGDEISKLQIIVTEKEVEIRDLKKDNLYLNQNKIFADALYEKNTKLNQTISDQEITIKALIITIKEMCKEDETNE